MLSFLLRYSNPTHPSAIINAGLVRFAAGSISYSSVLDFVPYFWGYLGKYVFICAVEAARIYIS